MIVFLLNEWRDRRHYIKHDENRKCTLEYKCHLNKCSVGHCMVQILQAISRNLTLQNFPLDSPGRC